MALLETLTDNFDDNSLDGGKWSADTAGGGTVTEQNQRLEMAGTFDQGCIVNGVTAFDLTASYGYAKVVGNLSGVVTLFGLKDPGGDEYTIWITVGGAVAFKKNIATVETQIGGAPAYVAADHAWFRIRESGGTIFGDVAPLAASNP